MRWVHCRCVRNYHAFAVLVHIAAVLLHYMCVCVCVYTYIYIFFYLWPVSCLLLSVSDRISCCRGWLIILNDAILRWTNLVLLLCDTFIENVWCSSMDRYIFFFSRRTVSIAFDWDDCYQISLLTFEYSMNTFIPFTKTNNEHYEIF